MLGAVLAIGFSTQPVFAALPYIKVGFRFWRRGYFSICSFFEVMRLHEAGSGLPGTSARYERRLVVTPCAVETVGSVMHGGVGLCSCRHLVDEVCEGPVVPVTLIVHIAEFEVPAHRRGART